MHLPKWMIATTMLALSACTQNLAEAQEVDPLTNVRALVLAHAPYKQWNIATGNPSREIGRTPGAACEVISFLAADARRPENRRSAQEAARLANWVIGLQQRGQQLGVTGGVPSTPDLAPPMNSYYYSIDAAFCGSAMLDMAELTGESRYKRSASDFGRFLLTMMHDPSAAASNAPISRGLCEHVVQQPGRASAWNCQRFVKNLVALPLFKRLDQLEPEQGYRRAAATLRSALMPGLEGLWEYAEETQEGRLQWRRIQGPHGEKDHFVYGDTLAYALKGLHGYEGASPTVRRLYARFTGMKGKAARVASYDGRIALAGYILAGEEAPDPLSAYYDTVTLGLLQQVRRDVAPADAVLADRVLRRDIATAKTIGWHMDMERRPGRGRMGDISTLAALGLALTQQ